MKTNKSSVISKINKKLQENPLHAPTKKLNIDKEGNEFCYSYMPSESIKGGFDLVKMVKGVYGYWVLSGRKDTVREIKELCAEMNKKIGLNGNQVLEIELSALNAKPKS